MAQIFFQHFSDVHFRPDLLDVLLLELATHLESIKKSSILCGSACCL